jgi:flavodoxin I
MNRTAIIYSYNTKKTENIAIEIQKAFNSESIEMVNAEEITAETFSLFDQLILGVATWFDGELPNYWDEFVPALEEMDLTGTMIALFGLGDQKGYSENFLDGVGLMAEILENQGAMNRERINAWVEQLKKEFA